MSRSSPASGVLHEINTPLACSGVGLGSGKLLLLTRLSATAPRPPGRASGVVLAEEVPAELRDDQSAAELLTVFGAEESAGCLLGHSIGHHGADPEGDLA